MLNSFMPFYVNIVILCCTRSMDFMMNARGSTEMLMLGDIVQMSLTILHFLQS